MGVICLLESELLMWFVQNISNGFTYVCEHNVLLSLRIDFLYQQSLYYIETQTLAQSQRDIINN